MSLSAIPLVIFLVNVSSKKDQHERKRRRREIYWSCSSPISVSVKKRSSGHNYCLRSPDATGKIIQVIRYNLPNMPYNIMLICLHFDRCNLCTKAHLPI